LLFYIQRSFFTAVCICLDIAPRRRVKYSEKSPSASPISPTPEHFDELKHRPPPPQSNKEVARMIWTIGEMLFQLADVICEDYEWTK